MLKKYNLDYKKFLITYKETLRVRGFTGQLYSVKCIIDQKEVVGWYYINKQDNIYISFNGYSFSDYFVCFNKKLKNLYNKKEFSKDFYSIEENIKKISKKKEFKELSFLLDVINANTILGRPRTRFVFDGFTFNISNKIKGVDTRESKVKVIK